MYSEINKMEYLNSITNKLQTIKESDIQYLDVFKNPVLVYGNTINSDRVNFCKFPQEVENELKRYGVHFFMQYHKTSACGNRIRFKTDSHRIVLKVQLKRAQGYKEMVSWNSSGFDIYTVDEEGQYHPSRLIAPKFRKSIFAEQIWLPENSSVCIFLPNYDTIEKMYIGIEKGSRIKTFKYKKNKRKPIVFYGNGITQGASASKSGNSFPNIVSRKMDQDIINLSTFNACKATPKISELIGTINCDSIVIDYSRNAKYDDFKQRYDNFYKEIRKQHPDKKIILMTVASFNFSKQYEKYDDIILNTYKNAKKRGENTFLLNQRELFDKKEYPLIATDGCHYNDIGMFRIAEKICEILSS